MSGHLHNLHQSQQQRQGGIDHILKERARSAQMPTPVPSVKRSVPSFRNSILRFLFILIGAIIGMVGGPLGIPVGGLIGGFLGSVLFK
jgi:hypothetical protein